MNFGKDSCRSKNKDKMLIKNLILREDMKTDVLEIIKHKYQKNNVGEANEK